MSNNSINPDDATRPASPPAPYPAQQPPPRQAPQGKLVLGSFQNPPPPTPERRPYQYPPQQPPRPQGPPPRTPQGPQPQGPYNAPNYHPQQRPPNQYAPTRPATPQQPGPYGPPRQNPPSQPGQYHNNAPRQQAPTVSPGVNPNARPGQMNGPRPEVPAGKPKRRRNKGCAIGCGTVLVLLLIVIIFGAVTVPRVLAFGSAISTKAPLTSDANLLTTANRTNLLIMGFGGSGHDGAYLTDSMVVMSLMPQSHHTSIVSVPRDLWVSNPADQGQQTKINAIYEFASNNNQNPSAGGDAVDQEVSTLTGLDVKYWLTINFQGFQKLIDSIGGVDVVIPDTFTANYPANDDPAVDPNWTTVTFTKSSDAQHPAHMTGKTAIQYARARYVIDNNAEASDFARSQRQQLIIKAVLAKVKQISTWPKLFDAMDALQQTIRTNMSLEDLGLFASKMDLNSSKGRIGLSVSNVLDYGQSDDGQSILVPQGGDWGLLKTYVQQNLYQ